MSTTTSDPQLTTSPEPPDEMAILAAEMGITRAEASRQLRKANIAVVLNRVAEMTPDAEVAA